MNALHVLIADRSRARLLCADAPHGALREEWSLVHGEARLPEHELTADLPGRTHDRLGAARHAMQPRHSPAEVAADALAREAAVQLDERCTRGELQRLVLVAAPDMLGLVRRHLSPATRRRVAHELHKNLAQCSASELRARLDAILV